MTGDAVRRLRELVREAAFYRHCSHLGQASGDHRSIVPGDFQFSACPHPDCALARADVELVEPDLIAELRAEMKRIYSITGRHEVPTLTVSMWLDRLSPRRDEEPTTHVSSSVPPNRVFAIQWEQQPAAGTGVRADVEPAETCPHCGSKIDAEFVSRLRRSDPADSQPTAAVAGHPPAEPLISPFNCEHEFNIAAWKRHEQVGHHCRKCGAFTADKMRTGTLAGWLREQIVDLQTLPALGATDATMFAQHQGELAAYKRVESELERAESSR